MPAFSLTPINAFPQATGTEFPNPLLFSLDDTLFAGPITQVNFTDGTVTERGDGILDVTLGGGGGTTYSAGSNISFTGPTSTIINAIPSGQSTSFQWNNSGAFGGTVGLSWTAELGSTPALIAFSDLLIDPPNIYNLHPQRQEFFLDLIDRGQLYMTAITLGTHIYSAITYPPAAGNIPTLDRSGLWVGGSVDNSNATGQCYDGWFLSDSMAFAKRDDQTVFTHIKPLSLKGSPTTPTAFDDAIQVTINGGDYWIPCVSF